MKANKLDSICEEWSTAGGIFFMVKEKNIGNKIMYSNLSNNMKKSKLQTTTTCIFNLQSMVSNCERIVSCTRVIIYVVYFLK